MRLLVISPENRPDPDQLIPGIQFVQNAVYRWIANHRYRFPGTTPYCESHPVGC